MGTLAHGKDAASVRIALQFLLQQPIEGTTLAGWEFVGWSGDIIWSDDSAFAEDSSRVVMNGSAQTITGNENYFQLLISSGSTTTMSDDNTDVADTLSIGGILELGTTGGHDYGTVIGTGTLRLASPDFPDGDFANFASSSGGTVEYNGSNNHSISATQKAYNNLIFSGSGRKTKQEGTGTITGMGT